VLRLTSCSGVAQLWAGCWSVALQTLAEGTGEVATPVAVRVAMWVQVPCCLLPS